MVLNRHCHLKQAFLENKVASKYTFKWHYTLGIVLILEFIHLITYFEKNKLDLSCNRFQQL